MGLRFKFEGPCLLDLGTLGEVCQLQDLENGLRARQSDIPRDSNVP